MSTELEVELRGLNFGDHACLLYDSGSPADDWATIVPYFKEGLARGERCHLVIREPDEPQRLMQLLSDAGLDVDRCVERRALLFDTDDRFGFVHGRFEAQAELEAVESVVQKSLADGFSGLRCCGQIPHARDGRIVDERAWIEFEARLNEVMPSKRLVTVCRYDVRRCAPSFIRELLRIHPRAVLGPLVCPCTYYEPPRMALGECTEEECVRWMMDQLYRARVAQRALEQALQARDDFLSAASHELRTPLTPALLEIQNALRSVERGDEHQASTKPVAARLRRAQEHLARTVSVVQRLVEASLLREDRVQLEVESVDLLEVTRTVLDRFAGEMRRANCTVNLDAPPDPVVGRWIACASSRSWPNCSRMLRGLAPASRST
jgi:signal transduction histidine kinase